MNVSYTIDGPTLTAMPYGGRLEWKLPGGHSLVAHLKNEKLIRRRKRWSQVMYMYYLLGFLECDQTKLNSYQKKLESNRNKLESDRKKLESDRNKLESDSEKLESNRNKLESERKKLEFDRKKLESDRNNSESDRNKLESDRKKLESDQKKLESDQTKLESEEKNVESDRKKLESGIKKFKSDQQQLESDKITLETYRKQLESDRGNLQFDEKKLERDQEKLHNIFLLALDGDVDFKPKAVALMIDRMRKNPAVGAACGRIHPTGSGVMVWYQIFEYALSHWFQKATEDKFGCVLCSPGCFSLYRASAISKVIETYTTKPTEPKHYIQFDQGEDRWLCTLLLQQGHRIEYCAAADALTHAPERFEELFNQRKRWIPSTMANILDLLSNWKHITQKNPYISNSYMFYQSLLMVSSILTPGTTFLMILGAIHLAYPEIELWSALLINAIPVGIFIVLCFVAKPSTQITFAAILSSLYSLLMMIVIVALVRQAGAYGMCSIATLFIVFVAGIFVLAAILHPQEFLCIIHGFVYFLAIPATSMILMIYSLVNLHNISWGTRENKPGTHKPGQHKMGEGLCTSLFTRCCSTVERFFQRRNDDDRDAINRTRDRDLEESNDNQKQPVSESPEMLWTDEINKEKINSLLEEKSKCEDEIMANEVTFWTEIIEKYLKPLDPDDKTKSQTEKKKKEQEERKELRNKVCLSVVLINLLFIIIVFSLQQGVEKGRSLSIQLPCATTNDTGQSIEPISVTFTLMFGILLCVQFTCMLVHRMSTFVHILAATSIFTNKKRASCWKWLKRNSQFSHIPLNNNDITTENIDINELQGDRSESEV